MKIGGDIPLEAAALLACGVITGLGAVVNSAKVRDGQDVVVVGTGGVGLSSVQGAGLSNAGKVIAVDLSRFIFHALVSNLRLRDETASART